VHRDEMEREEQNTELVSIYLRLYVNLLINHPHLADILAQELNLLKEGNE
jgi:hypothetical protein